MITKMMCARLALLIMGGSNRKTLDQMTEVLCGTRKNYELNAKGPIIDLLVRRWLKSEELSK